MTTKEKIIKRLNEAFGFDIPNDAFFTTHIKRYGHYDDAFSWAVSWKGSDIGCYDSMTECLKWDKWVYSRSLHAIFEHHDCDKISSWNDLVED